MHGELNKFGRDIDSVNNNLKCTAVLRPLDPYLHLTLTGDGKGHIHVTGVARQNPGSKTVLEFEFEMDQTELPLVANALLLADRAG